MALYQNQMRNLGQKKIIQGTPQQLDYMSKSNLVGLRQAPPILSNYGKVDQRNIPKGPPFSLNHSTHYLFPTGTELLMAILRLVIEDICGIPWSLATINN